VNSQKSPETSKALDLSRKSLIKALEYDDLTIPVLPKIAQDIMMMSQDPNADIEALSNLIYRDQSIASHVLHISNSAAFGGFGRVESIDEAVARLGMKLLSEIAISVSIQKNVFNIPAYKAEIQGMWQHSLASAIFAKEIAQYARENTEILYLCGLLHEIGKPVTLFTINNLPDEIKEGLTKPEALTLVEEFHMSVGTIVTRQWELPEPIQFANLYYKDAYNAPLCQREVLITSISDKLSSAALCEDGDFTHALEDKVFQKLEIAASKIERLLDVKDTVVERVSSMKL
jgi:putative nucleotidyltransferase with HDIG domain